MHTDEPYPPIQDYGFIGDGHSVALVDRRGSIDWCCMGRIDRESCFGRLLDWDQGGHCQIAPLERRLESERRYLPGTLVLETRFRTARGEARLLDAFAMREGGREDPDCRLLRVVECVRGEVAMRADVSPRFDYGELRPWVREHSAQLWSVIGGDLGLVIGSDLPIHVVGRHDLCASFTLRQGERRRICLRAQPPHHLYPCEPEVLDLAEIDRMLDDTVAWWVHWSARARADFPHGVDAVRSAIVLKGLTFAPTGAIAAAATTSLPEHLGGERNWDYRFSWVRDSSFALQSLVALGYEHEAQGFRWFLERATAGSAAELEVMYGVDGNHQLPEVELASLAGYRGSRPVRVGNAAHKQLQLDTYGNLLETAWRSAQCGRPPCEAYWEFLVDVVNTACHKWKEPDHGIWETRGAPEHFVYSKVMCWVACNRALALAERFSLHAPMERWRETRDDIRAAVESDGFDARRGVFIRSFGARHTDAALLLLPRVGFVAYDDDRMLRTVDAVCEELLDDGLLRRYRAHDGLSGHEGVFVACTFWLVECLVRQDRREEAERVFERACEQGNDLGLFAEEYDTKAGLMLGNFPQGLSHYSHISALLALADRGGAEPDGFEPDAQERS